MHVPPAIACPEFTAGYPWGTPMLEPAEVPAEVQRYRGVCRSAHVPPHGPLCEQTQVGPSVPRAGRPYRVEDRQGGAHPEQLEAFKRHASTSLGTRGHNTTPASSA